MRVPAVFSRQNVAYPLTAPPTGRDTDRELPIRSTVPRPKSGQIPMIAEYA